MPAALGLRMDALAHRVVKGKNLSKSKNRGWLQLVAYRIQYTHLRNGKPTPKATATATAKPQPKPQPQDMLTNERLVHANAIFQIHIIHHSYYFTRAVAAYSYWFPCAHHHHHHHLRRPRRRGARMHFLHLYFQMVGQLKFQIFKFLHFP